MGRYRRLYNFAIEMRGGFRASIIYAPGSVEL
jgi:hypothetical protein